MAALTEEEKQNRKYFNKQAWNQSACFEIGKVLWIIALVFFGFCVAAVPLSGIQMVPQVLGVNNNLATMDLDEGAPLVRYNAALPAEAKLDLAEKTPDDFEGTDTQKVQAALDAGGKIRLTREYAITSALTISGGTHVVGDPDAKLTWAGPTVGSIIQDSSRVDTSIINSGITLENFEIDGGDLLDGDAGQIGINFYRVKNVHVKGVTLHGLGGSGIRWGMSQDDTENILIEDCFLHSIRQGDAIQGVGKRIVVRNNRIGIESSANSNFGDSAIALLYDFGALTNSARNYSTDVEVSDNTIFGNYIAGTYSGNGQNIQAGLAFGPFAIGSATNLRILRNTLRNCYLNVWVIVMDGVLLEANDFGPHAATATGNLRFDGVTNLRVKNNKVALAYASAGVDYAAILLVAQRNTYGASVFDADVSDFEVSGNTISAAISGLTGVRATFEQANTAPTYVSKLERGTVEGNTFKGITTPLALAPQTGHNVDTCIDVTISANTVDSAATAIVSAGGGANQYVDVRVLDNNAPGALVPWAGAGIDHFTFEHKVADVTSASTGTPMALMTLPTTGYFRLDINAYVKAGRAAFSGTMTVTGNARTHRISSLSDSANLTMTVADRQGKGVQKTAVTNDIFVRANYSSPSL